MANIIMGPAEGKAENFAKFTSESFSVYLAKHEEYLATNKWLAGDKISLGDFWFGALYVDHLTNEANPNAAVWAPIMAKYPNVARWGADFREENKVWLAARPAGAM